MSKRDRYEIGDDILSIADFLLGVEEDCRNCVVPTSIIARAIRGSETRDQVQSRVNRFNADAKRFCLGASDIEGKIYCGHVLMVVPPKGMTPEEIQQAGAQD